MKSKIIIFLFLVAFFSCKKKESTTTPATVNPTHTTRNFSFKATDEGNNAITTLTGNTFFINFYQSNNLAYSVRTKSVGNFFLNDFKEGHYVYEITDSLNLFGYVKDSIIFESNKYYMHNTLNPGVDWNQYPIAQLNLTIQQKPTFTISTYTTRDTGSIGNQGLYVKINVSGITNKGALAIYFYKNNTVSKDNSFNYAVLYPNGFDLSNTQTSTSNIFYDYNLMQHTALHSGDSVYFAVYPAPWSFSSNSVDAIGKLDTLGWPQYTAIGNQRIIIPYKFH